MNPAIGTSSAGEAQVVAPPGGGLIQREEAQLEILVAALADPGARPRPPPLHMHATCLAWIHLQHMLCTILTAVDFHGHGNCSYIHVRYVHHCDVNADILLRQTLISQKQGHPSKLLCCERPTQRAAGGLHSTKGPT